MNCNPDHTPLTIEQLEGMARTLVDGAEMANQRGVHDKHAMWESWLLTLTRQLRFDMCMQGQLVCDTRQRFMPKPPRSITIDPFFLKQQHQ